MPRDTRKQLAATTPHSIFWRSIRQKLEAYWRRGFWQRLICIITAIVILAVSGMYTVAQWYIHKHADEPLTIGATFIPSYAKEFGLDPQETLQAMISELGLRKFRLVSYWSIHEPEPGKYDFSELDWQFDMIEQAGGKVSLAIGLRQPRWPECHMPAWAAKLPKQEWSSELKDYMGKVIERYKDRKSLVSYQLENEFFMTVFGDCPDHSRDRLVDEYNYVKQLDPDRTVIVSRSNNWVGIPVGQPQADTAGISVYKRVWDQTFTKRYFEYPLPAWYYAFLAGAGELVTGTPMVLHELQTEAWPPNTYRNLAETPLKEQDKSLNAERLEDRIEYGVATGIRSIDLWGVEWWYWRKVKQNDPSIWNKAQEVLEKYR